MWKGPSAKGALPFQWLSGYNTGDSLAGKVRLSNYNERRRLRRLADPETVRLNDRLRYKRDRKRIKERQRRYYHLRNRKMRKAQYEKQKGFWCARQKTYYEKWISETIKLLGGVCACCGESQREFLCFDHVKNDGRLEKRNKGGSRSRSFVTKIRRALRSGNPRRIAGIKEAFQILCQNCNYSKHRGKGICIHKRRTHPTRR